MPSGELNCRRVDVQTDHDIDEFIRNTCETTYHPCGTCKMGDTADNMAVVDSNTNIIGLENIRVVDASIMPSIVSGNLNAPTIMMAEKAADLIKKMPPLPPSSSADFYKADTSTEIKVVKSRNSKNFLRIYISMSMHLK